MSAFIPTHRTLCPMNFFPETHYDAIGTRREANTYVMFSRTSQSGRVKMIDGDGYFAWLDDDQFISARM